MNTINCANCQTENQATANYCQHCGNNFTIKTLTRDRRDLFVFISILALGLSAIFWFVPSIIYRITDNFDVYEIIEIPGQVLSLITSVVPLLLAFSIKKLSYRIVSLIFASICTMIHLFWFIDNLIPKEDFEFFNF